MDRIGQPAGIRRVKTRIRSAAALFMAIALTLSCGATAYAAQPQHDRTVRVACGFNMSLYLDAGGEPQGHCADYLAALANINRWQLEFLEGGFNEGLRRLYAGEVDLVFPLQPTPERREYMAFSAISGGYQPIYLFAKKGEDVVYHDFEAAEGARIAVSEGGSNELALQQYAAKYGFHYTPVYIDSTRGKAEAVESGRADYIAASTVADPDGYMIVGMLDCPPFYYAVRKGDTALLAELDSGMKRILSEQPEVATKVALNFLKSGITVANTREQIEWLKNDGEIVVGVYLDTPPMYHQSAGEQAHGIFVDLLKLLTEKTGANIRIYPISRDTYAYDLLRDGTIDALLGSNDLPLKAMNDSEYTYSAAILDYTTVTISRNDYVRSADNTPLFVLTTARKYWEPMILKNFPGATIQYAENAKDCLIAVQNGSADLTLLNAWEFNHQSKNARFNNLIEWESDRAYADVVMSALFDADATMISILDKGIAELNADELSNIITVNLNRQYDTFTTADKFYANKDTLLTIAVVLLALLGAFAIYAYTRRRYARQLELNNQQLMKANTAKTEFLAKMSHDMRTPMNGILGLSYIMEDEQDITQIKKAIPQLRESGEYLLQMINDVLDMNKVESGKIELHPAPCDGKRLFDSVLSLLRPQMAEKNIDFHFEINGQDWRYVLLDEQRVKQIFVNLLGNAVKYTPPGGRIDLIMEQTAQDDKTVRARFVIRDTGIGMDAAFLPHAFESFRQEERMPSALGGTGLGLSIVKSLVELMGGTIAVKSEIDKGTEFTLCLTFPLAERADAETDPDTKQEASDRLSGVHILLCEDHPLNAQIAMRLLEKQGAQITWKENGLLGKTAFEESENGYYDAILMDIRMPVMNGLDAAKAIRGMDRPDAKTIPIIAMTANAYDDDVQKSLEAGMNAHLAKPIVPRLLYETLEKAI